MFSKEEIEKLLLLILGMQKKLTEDYSKLLLENNELPKIDENNYNSDYRLLNKLENYLRNLEV